MSRQSFPSTSYDAFRRGSLRLGRLAIAVQVGGLLLGLSLFLDQARDLISDAQFTWGERRVMAIAALMTLGGCGLAGWIMGQILRLSASALEVLADGAESAARTNELIEEHLIPALGRIASVLEDALPQRAAGATGSMADRGAEALRADLVAAQAAGRVGRAIELRDALTRHLRGEALHELDRGLAVWLLNLVERRVESRTVDAEVAGWLARALDSLGEMPEAEPLRQALPALRRQAGLCVRCGRVLAAAARDQQSMCPVCQHDLATAPPDRNARPRTTRTREQS
jgi:hypothetical protein